MDLPYEPYPWFKGRFALRTGVLLIAEVALVSFISVAGLLIVVATRTIKRHSRRRAGRALAEDEPIQPVALLFILAMCMELVQAFANILSVRWAFQGATTEGGYCTAQAVLKQLGNDGAALFTMFLGIMTLVPTVWPSVLMGNRGRRAVLGMIAFVVVFWLFMITIPATTIDHYYGSTGPWCWIPTSDADGSVSKIGEVMGILTEYAWFWLASLTCFVCYGYIVVRWWREAKNEGGERDPEMIRQAVVMAWYPIAYFVEIFPQSVVRVLSMHAKLVGHPAPPDGWTVFTSVLFASSGWVNVLLWVITGRQFGFTAASARVVDDGLNSSEAMLEGGKNTYALRPGTLGVDRESSAGHHGRGVSLEHGLLPDAANPSFPDPRHGPSPTSADAFLPDQPYTFQQGGYEPGEYYPYDEHR